jgi:gamma-glutamyltranspeptidase/glutathione hydrolase
MCYDREFFRLKPEATGDFLRAIVAVVILTSLACGKAPERMAVQHVAGSFVAPEAWAFPAGRVVPAYGTDGVVATTDRVASEIGAEVLRRGGNAVDAAVAIQFALAVVNPEAGNIGGGGFMVVRMADGRTAALDFREKAPAAARRNMYLDASGAVTDGSVVGHLASGVPGSVAGMWEAHKRFASHPWSEVIQPAINLADGLIVHERLARSLQAYEGRLQRYPPTAATNARLVASVHSRTWSRDKYPSAARS